jgi:exodeoxyribonuclease VII large subunit
MTEPPVAPDSAGNIPEFTVSELSVAVKRSIEGAFDRVSVRGEVSGVRRPGSGHVYFSLKDENAVLAAVCWRGVAAKLRHQPEDGLEMICSGRLTTYPGQSKYQIVVDRIEPAGEGALLKLLEERKKMLAAEGLFDEERKRPLPWLPEVIGVVTSPTGAVIRDILHRLADRFPRHVLIWPVRVQGDEAAAEIAAAIAGFNRLTPAGAPPRPDVLIIARGGGSIEDLWAFNEEIVARAAAGSEIPLISAVGHETDVTLIDFAADRRAPTPTAAAEIAVPVRVELAGRVLDLERRMAGAVARLVETRRVELRGLARGLPDVRGLMDLAMQRLDIAGERLKGALRQGIVQRRAEVAGIAAQLRHPREIIAAGTSALAMAGHRLVAALRARLGEGEQRIGALGRLLESFGYEQVLARGFVLARDDAGLPVTSAASATPGMGLALTFHDGERHATVDGARPRRKKSTPPDTKASQGELL